MKLEDLRHAHQTRPFRPFTIRVADGREYPVKHPEFMAFSVSGRTIVVSTADDVHEIIDTVLVTSIHLGNGAKGKRRRKKA